MRRLLLTMLAFLALLPGLGRRVRWPLGGRLRAPAAQRGGAAHMLHPGGVGEHAGAKHRLRQRVVQVARQPRPLFQRRHLPALRIQAGVVDRHGGVAAKATASSVSWAVKLSGTSRVSAR